MDRDEGCVKKRRKTQNRRMKGKAGRSCDAL